MLSEFHAKARVQHGVCQCTHHADSSRSRIDSAPKSREESKKEREKQKQGREGEAVAIQQGIPGQ